MPALGGISRAIVASVIIAIVIIAGVAYYLISQGPSKYEQSPTRATAGPIVSTQQVETKKDVLRVAIGVDIDTLDPHGQTTGAVINILRHVYETLLWFDDQGKEVIPWLAEKWEVSPDGLVYTFYLRKGVRFHDGSEFNATVVKANFDRWFDPSVRVPARGQLGPVNRTEVVDPYTIRIYLSKPYAPFIKVLASFPMITSLNVIKRFGNQSITEVIGTGPYRFVSWEKGKRVVLERNEDYWGPKPPIKRIEWLIIPEASTRLSALLAGDVDFAFNLPPSDLDRVKNDPRFEALTPLTDRVIFIVILPKGPLADPRVRQALNYAVDREAIVENILYGLALPADSVVPPHHFGYVKMDPYSYDPQRARRMLEEAGFPFDRTFVLLHPTGRYLQDKQVAEAVQAYLSRIGLKVELRTSDWPSFVASITKPLDQKDYDLLLLGWGAAAPDAHFILFNQFHSSQAPPRGLAAAHYNNSAVDRLLEQAMVETDQQKRLDLYKQAIEIIWRDAPWIFLYTQKNFAAKVSNLEGVIVHFGENFYFVKAWFK